MSARNSIELSIPLLLQSGRTIQASQCHLTADSLEGYTDCPVARHDQILLDFAISSGDGASQTFRKIYEVTHAHPETHEDRLTTWFMAVPPVLEQ